MTRWTKRRDGIVRTTIRVPVHLTLARVRQIAERTGWSEEKAVRALREAVESCVANTLQMRTVVLETGCLDLDDFESYEGGDPRVLGGL